MDLLGLLYNFDYILNFFFENIYTEKSGYHIIYSAEMSICVLCDFRLVNRTYRLVCLKSTTPEELYARKVCVLPNQCYFHFKASMAVK